MYTLYNLQLCRLVKYIVIYPLTIHYSKAFNFFTVLPSIFGNNDPVSVIVNKPVRLECEATGFPAPSLTWLKDGIPVSSISGGIQVLFKLSRSKRVLISRARTRGESSIVTPISLNQSSRHGGETREEVWLCYPPSKLCQCSTSLLPSRSPAAVST